MNELLLPCILNLCQNYRYTTCALELVIVFMTLLSMFREICSLLEEQAETKKFPQIISLYLIRLLRRR